VPVSVDTHDAAQPFLDQPWQFCDALPPMLRHVEQFGAGFTDEIQKQPLVPGRLAYGPVIAADSITGPVISC